MADVGEGTPPEALSPAPGGEDTPESEAPEPKRFRAVGAPFQIPQAAASWPEERKRPPADRPDRPTVYRAGESTDSGPAVENWATRWLLPMLRVALSLPLVYIAAVSAGLALYLLYLLGGHAHDEPPHLTLGLAAAAVAVVCAFALLGFATALRECPRRRLWLWSFVGSLLAAAGAGAALALGVDRLLAGCAAAALSYTAVTAGVCGIIRACHWDPGRPVESLAGRSWRAWPWRVLVAIVACLFAAAAAALAFSLAAASFVPAQAQFSLGSSIWQEVTARHGVGLVGGVLALVAANAGVAALFGLLVHVAVRTLGWWRGRLHVWWLGVAGVTVALGVIAWILERSLPR